MKFRIVIFYLLLKYQLSTSEVIKSQGSNYTNDYPDDDYSPYPKSLNSADENTGDVINEQINILSEQNQQQPDTQDISSLPILINPEIIKMVADHLNQGECTGLIFFLSKHPSAQQPEIRTNWMDLQQFNFFCPIPLKIWNSEVINLYLYKNNVDGKEALANNILEHGLGAINRFDLIDKIREIYTNQINDRFQEHEKMSLEERLEDRLAPLSKFNFKESKSKKKNVIRDADADTSIDSPTTDKPPKYQKKTYIVYFLLAFVGLVILCSLIIWYLVKKFYIPKSKSDKKFYSKVATLADQMSDDEESDTVLV